MFVFVLQEPQSDLQRILTDLAALNSPNSIVRAANVSRPPREHALPMLALKPFRLEPVHKCNFFNDGLLVLPRLVGDFLMVWLSRRVHTWVSPTECARFSSEPGEDVQQRQEAGRGVVCEVIEPAFLEDVTFCLYFFIRSGVKTFLFHTLFVSHSRRALWLRLRCLFLFYIYRVVLLMFVCIS